MYARYPPRQVLIPLPGYDEPRILNHAPELFLCRKALNALHQILVTVPIARDELPNQRYGAEAPSLVRRVEEAAVDVAEFETRENAAGFEDAESLAQRSGFVGEVADAEGDGIEIDAAGGDGGE